MSDDGTPCGQCGAPIKRSEFFSHHCDPEKLEQRRREAIAEIRRLIGELEALEEELAWLRAKSSRSA